MFPLSFEKVNSVNTDHPISNFIFYDHLNPQFRQFVTLLSSASIPKSCEEVLLVSARKQAMNEEMDAIVSQEIWELVSAPTNVVVGCRWVYTLKYHPDGSVDRSKARLMAKDYTQTYRVDYFEMFSLVARMNSIRIIFSVVNLSWSLCQLDVKNAFLYGDLQEEVYIKQPPGYVAQRENKICRLKKAIYGLNQSPRAWFEKFSITFSGIDFSPMSLRSLYLWSAHKVWY